MIQHDVFVRDRHAGVFQFTEGADDIVRLHSALLRIVVANNKDAGMSPVTFENQVVQLLEIIVIPRQERPAFADRLPEMNRIISAGQANLDRRPNVMSRLP